MRHHHHVIAHLAGAGRFERLAQVQRNLMPEKSKSTQVSVERPLGASQHAAVKSPRRVQVGHVIGEVKKPIESLYLLSIF